jgi:subtilisin family serine protease
MRTGSVLSASLLLLGAAAFANPAKVRNFNVPHKDGEFIVRFADDMSRDEQIAFMHNHQLQPLKFFRSAPAALVKVAAHGRALSAKSVSIAAQPEVRLVEANTIIKINVNTNDPSYGRQYGHDKIEAPAAWDMNTGSKEVVVAVIDTGVNYNHPDLAANYWYNQGESGMDANGNEKSSNGIDDDANGYVDDFRGWDFADKDNDPMDDNGHGTHCSGIIGAVGNNGEGIAGVNWNTSIVGLRFIGSNGEGTSADAIEAIEYATMMGFDLTNASWGGDPESETEEDLVMLKEAIRAAGDAGNLFIAASGNEMRDIDKQPVYPAAYDLDNIVSVGSTDSFDLKSFFSNYGKVGTDLFAPGSSIYSTYHDGYASLSGTSMATPYVTGAAALLKASEPNLTNLEIKERLMGTVDKKTLLEGRSVTGGRLNVRRALQAEYN